MTLAARVGNIESDNARLRLLLAEKVKEIAELRGKINQVTLLAGLPKLSESAATLPRMAQKILHLLMEREFVAHEVLEAYLYNGTARDVSCIKVHITKLRKLLPPGVTIRNNRGVGYYIPRNEKMLVRR